MELAQAQSVKSGVQELLILEIQLHRRQNMHWLFSPPTIDDIIRLLKAWRFWSVVALIGA